MNLQTDFPVVLRIEAAEFAPSCREELLGLLADYSVVAIHEDETEAGICWWVSFGGMPGKSWVMRTSTIPTPTDGSIEPLRH
jgi:hypothetical protein